jgi:hypothetical protein
MFAHDAIPVSHRLDLLALDRMRSANLVEATRLHVTTTFFFWSAALFRRFLLFFTNQVKWLGRGKPRSGLAGAHGLTRFSGLKISPPKNRYKSVVPLHPPESNFPETIMAVHTGSLETIISRLIHQLKDPDESVRLHAAAALGLMGRKAQTAIPGLTEALRDSDRLVRRMAASALEVIVPKEFRARSA